MKFVQHAGITGGAIKCFIPSAEGGSVAGKPKQDMIVFKPEVIDHIAREQIHSGYTRLEDVQYVALVRYSKLFNQSVERGFLLVLDELPYSAQTPADIIANLRQQVADQQTQLDVLKTGKGAGTSGGSQEADDKIKALEAIIASKPDKKALKELTDAVAQGLSRESTLEAQIAALQAGNDDGQTLAYLNAILDAIDPAVVAVAKSTVENKAAAASSGPDF